MASLEIVRRKTVVLNSFNRESGSIQEATFHFPPLVSTIENVEAIQVVPTLFVTKRSWYSVDSKNNTFQVHTIGTTGSTSVRTITLAPGNYNYRTFLVELMFELNRGQPTTALWNVGWNDRTHKYTYTPPNDTRQYAFRFTNFLCHQLGFEREDVIVESAFYYLSFTNPLTSRYPLRMNNENLLVVRTNLPIVSDGNIDNLANHGMIQELSLIHI